MTSHIVKLMKGNRVTIPKKIVDKLGIEDYVVLSVENGKIILQPAKVIEKEGSK